jgi:putative phosphoesterase
MKKLVVMSDNHGDEEMLFYVRENEQDADYYIHCGDSETARMENLRGYICVKGNNDWHLDLPNEAFITVEDVNVMITHGQHLGYFNRELAMNDILTQNDCQLLLCGHTHMPMFMEDGELTYINPGSTSLPRGGSRPSYAIVTIDGKKIDCEFKIIKKRLA